MRGGGGYVDRIRHTNCPPGLSRSDDRDWMILDLVVSMATYLKMHERLSTPAFTLPLIQKRI